MVCLGSRNGRQHLQVGRRAWEGSGTQQQRGRESAYGPRRAPAWPPRSEMCAHGTALHICSHWSSQCYGAAWEGVAWSSLPAEMEVRKSRALTGSWQKPPEQKFQVENKGSVQGKKPCEV